MPLRLLEVTVDSAGVPKLDELLAERDVVIHSRTATTDDREIVRVVVPVEHTEALTDALASSFGASSGYRGLILAVEAVLPAPDPEPVTDSTSGSEKPPPARVSREELYQDVKSAAELTPVYLATVGLSAIVAAAGLIRGDVAVIIGAMVIAPLLGPTVAFALGLTLGDNDLTRLAARATAAGVALALGLAALAGLLFTIDPAVPELAARTRVGFSDIVIAMAAGAAGSLAYTTGLPTAIIGVMVAVALLPPLVAAGLLLGAGHLELAAGSTVLLLVNFTCISLAAISTFFVRRVRPRTWWEAEKARKATRLGVISWLVLLAILAGLILFLNREGSPGSDTARPTAEETPPQ